MSKALRSIFRRREVNEEERFYAMLSGAFRQHSFITNTGEDDAMSIDSFSTTATANDLPGPGRTIDTHFYQPVGRRIERFAMRISIRFLHPLRILAFIQDTYPSGVHMLLFKAPLSCAIEYFNPTAASGLKSLVRQAQSENIYRSIAALTSLIHASTTFPSSRFFPAVSEVEPFISHVGGLVGALEDSKLEKRYFRVLIDIARATTFLYDRKEVPEGLIHETAERSIRLIYEYRSGRLDFLAALTDACYLLALNISCLDFYERNNQIECDYTLESLYFLLVFTTHLLDRLFFFVNRDQPHSQYVVTSTLLTWLDHVFHSLRLSVYYYRYRGWAQLQIRASLCCIIGILSNKNNTSEHSRSAYINPDYLPRKIRATRTCCFHDPPIVETLVWFSTSRTSRLLGSMYELEREMLDINSSRKNGEFNLNEDSIDFRNELTEEELYRSMNLANRTRLSVPRNDLTREFHRACEKGRGDEWDHDNWDYYEVCRKSRHSWGSFFRSNLDWDWNLAACLKRLYESPRERAGALPSPILHESSQQSGASKNVEAVPKASLTNGLLEAVVEGAVDGAIHEVWVEIQSPTGEISYRTLRVVDQHRSSSGFGDDVGSPKDSRRWEPDMKMTARSEPVYSPLEDPGVSSEEAYARSF